MDNDLIKHLAKELAAKMNKLVNLPFLDEEQEGAFFELIILTVLEILFNKLGFKYGAK